MDNKSIETRAKGLLTELKPILDKLGWNDAAEIEQKVYKFLTKASPDTKMPEGGERLRQAVINLLQIGKRDLSNPKYDEYFHELYRNIGLPAPTAGAPSPTG